AEEDAEKTKRDFSSPRFFSASLRLRGELSVSRGVPRNQACPTIPGDVVVYPLGQYQQAILELHQVHQVYEDPHEPRKESPEVQLAEIGDCLIAADGREVALVEVVEGRQSFALETRADGARHIAALLH